MIKVLITAAGTHACIHNREHFAGGIISAVRLVEGYEEAEISVLIADDRIFSSTAKNAVILILNIERWYSDTLPPPITQSGEDPTKHEHLGKAVIERVISDLSRYRSASRPTVQARVQPFKRTEDEWVYAQK